jgi:hypothetical protein
MTGNPKINAHPRWLHFKAMCRYVDLSRSAMEVKLAKGTGPKFHKSPGSRNLIFWSGDLDAWILNAPPHPVTPVERQRLAKLQAGAERVRQERRARRRAEMSEDVTA